MLKKLYESLDTLDDLYELIDKAIVDEPPILITEGGVIKLGFNEEIDELKKAMTDSKTWLVELEAKEKRRNRNKRLKSRI